MVKMDKVVTLGWIFDKKMSADLNNKNKNLKVNIQILRTEYKEDIMKK